MFGGRAPMPSAARIYMGLGVSSRRITVECEVMTFFFMQSFVVAPLPIRSYVGLGMNSRNYIVMNLNLWKIFGAPTPRSEPSKQSTRSDMVLKSQRGFWGATPMPIRTYKGLRGATPLPLGTYEGQCVTMNFCTMHSVNVFCVASLTYDIPLAWSSSASSHDASAMYNMRPSAWASAESSHDAGTGQHQ